MIDNLKQLLMRMCNNGLHYLVSLVKTKLLYRIICRNFIGIVLLQVVVFTSVSTNCFINLVYYRSYRGQEPGHLFRN